MSSLYKHLVKARLAPSPTDKTTTPDVVARVVQIIQDRKAGRGDHSEPWNRYTLNLQEFKKLLQLLQSDEDLAGFVEHKLRYDYYSSSKQFIFRRPLYQHAVFLARVLDDIKDQINSIASSQTHAAEAAFARDVYHYGSASLKFPDSEYSEYSPDAHLGHIKARYPGVVIEVSFPQKKRYLPRLADHYILDSNANISVVVGLDMEYQGSKKATLSIWRPKIAPNDAGELELFVEETVSNQIIRDENGNPNESAEAGLVLELKDFGPEGLFPSGGYTCDPIIISAATLCSYIEVAEERVAMVEQRRGMIGPRQPGLKKRYREIAPAEEVEGRHEKRFRDSEERALELAERDDLSYEAGSASEMEDSQGS